LEEAARMSEAICTDGDDEADAVRERSGFDSRPGADPVPAPDITPFVAGEAIAADGDRQVRNRKKVPRYEKKEEYLLFLLVS
jgi:hypothetical protein